MPERIVDLTEQIQDFKNSVYERIKNNGDFHSVLNMGEKIEYKGLGILPNTYSIDAHEALLWTDPIAYYDELEQWQTQVIAERHQQAFACLDKYDQRPAFRDLVFAVRKQRIAPFLGAGLSAPMKYPTWGKAVELLIARMSDGANRTGKARCEQAQQAYDQGDYFQAVGILYGYNRDQVNEFIAEKFAVSPDFRLADVRGPLLLLPKFAEGCIITTNFDRLIEKVYDMNFKSMEETSYGLQDHNRFASALIKGGRCLLKLHGDAEKYETYIFSKAQYDRAYGDPIDFSKPLTRILRQIYISHSLLFIGCSLGRDRTMSVFEKLANAHDFEIPPHFAMLGAPHRSTERQRKVEMLRPLRIKPIWYDVHDEGKDHSELDNLLHLAIDAAAKRVRI